MSFRLNKSGFLIEAGAVIGAGFFCTKKAGRITRLILSTVANPLQ